MRSGQTFPVIPGRRVRGSTLVAVSSVTRPRLVVAALVSAAVALVLGACTPKDTGAVTELGAEAKGGPPAFPETGQVPSELLVEGIVYDLTNAPVDLDLWVLPREGAQCAAEKIVANHGVRLSDLGYEPGRTGAGLNDIALQSSERESISTLIQSCIDMAEAVASLFMGGDHMTSREALCLANGIEDKGLSGKFIDAWILGRGVDPLDEDDDGALASNLLAYADVCLPDTVFDWRSTELPGDEEVVGGDGSGSADTETSGDSGSDLPGSAGNITTTTEERPAGE